MEKTEWEVDTRRLVQAVLKKAWLICLVGAVCAGAVLLGTALLAQPQYQSDVVFCMDNHGNDAEISASDVSASRHLVDSAVVVLESRSCLREVAQAAGTDADAPRLREMIRAENVDDTEFLRVTVTAEDPEEALRIAGAIAALLPGHVEKNLKGAQARVMDEAETAQPVKTDYAGIGVMGFALGLLASLTAVTAWEIRNRRKENRA